MTKHPFHIVDFRPWPLTGAVGSLFIVTGLAAWIHKFDNNFIYVGLGLIILTIIQWWRDVTREATFQGKHTEKVEKGMRLGILLFISSEVFFFLAFFWAFFHSSLHPTLELGNVWPPAGITPINPLEVPLLNTIILLSRGCSITWAHMAVIEENWIECTIRIYVTVVLGFYFTIVQAAEYIFSTFTMSDGAYGSTFFVATGFHGLHVIIGTTFIAVILYRHLFYHFNKEHHFGFEARAWYWHFVDVVWLFLFLCIYWWGFDAAYFCKLYKLLSSYLKKDYVQKYLF